MINYDFIERTIGYKFKNRKYLLRAFTHSSFSKECNERLEFLGDSVLQIIVSQYLFNESTFDEGVLSKYRANIVCENNLYNAIIGLDLQKFLIVGDSIKGGPSKAMCADLCESIIGAIYLDSQSLEMPKEFIFNHIDLHLQCIDDNKTRLQELIQSNGLSVGVIRYESNQINENSNLNFEATLYINDVVYGKGKGRTKKEAEQNSAKIAIEKIKLGENNDI